jgi:hypothetical protein
MDIDVTCVEGFVFICTASTASILHVILEFSLHNSADKNDVSADARVNQIVFYFAVNCFWHFTRIYILDVCVNLLNSDPLEKRCFCGMLLSVEYTRSTVNTDTPVWLFPLTVDEVNVNI